MIGPKSRLIFLSFLLLLLIPSKNANTSVQTDALSDKIRAAQSDIRVFCLGFSNEDIQWTALLHLNRTYGAEIFVALVHPAPLFGCLETSTDDGQFHLYDIGWGVGMEADSIADSIAACLFDGIYPDIAILGCSREEDSSQLNYIVSRIKHLSQTDSLALAPLEKIYFYNQADTKAAVILNDRELYNRYSDKIEEIDKVFVPNGPSNYIPCQFRRYSCDETVKAKSENHGFISGFDTFRLPDFIAQRLQDGPEKRNSLNRLNRFRSFVRAAQSRPPYDPDRPLLLLRAYREIVELKETIRSGMGGLSGTRITHWANIIFDKTQRALAEVTGIDWNGSLQIRKTPFGKTAKLILDFNLTGSTEIELSYFKLHRPNRSPIIIDSISTIIKPHQKLLREYPVDISGIDLSDETADSLLFSVEVVIQGLSLDLYIPYREYSDEDVSITFLPGFSFIRPFDNMQQAVLAQSFDWQLKITKPFASEFDGRLNIHVPDGIVVGSYNKKIFMPQGTTARYLNIYLAAGRSIGYGLKRVGASLEVGGQTVAHTTAEVRIIRCQVPETRDIAYIPDENGQLEDFLRMARVSFQPFTTHSLKTASLEAYDLLVIGSEPTEFYDELRTVHDRLKSFVRDGGDILILGQSAAWPGSIFEFPVFASRSQVQPDPRLKAGDHNILKQPYSINVDQLLKSIKNSEVSWPAIVGRGDEIISAGELGSYLQVTKIGDGHIIYCGLPLLNMAAKLDVEAIHLLANLLNFGNDI